MTWAPRTTSPSFSRVATFLQGLVPENDAALRAIARRHGVDAGDLLDFLSAIGKDCRGAVQFCLEGEVEATIHRDGHLEEECSDGEIEARLDEMDTDEDASWTMPGEHWSLGGTRQKFALRRHDDRWFIAHDAEPTTHIVKPGVRKMRAQALVEHVTMRAAAALGVRVAHTEYTAFKSQDAIVVTRFDRDVAGDGAVVRRHQEDLCQAVGNDEKYEEGGGPTALDLIRLLRDSAAERRALRRLADLQHRGGRPRRARTQLRRPARRRLRGAGAAVRRRVRIRLRRAARLVASAVDERRRHVPRRRDRPRRLGTIRRRSPPRPGASGRPRP
nr:HipA domain-containing protein [Isoptericola sp. BMS4]